MYFSAIMGIFGGDSANISYDMSRNFFGPLDVKIIVLPFSWRSISNYRLCKILCSNFSHSGNPLRSPCSQERILYLLVWWINLLSTYFIYVRNARKYFSKFTYKESKSWKVTFRQQYIILCVSYWILNLKLRSC